MLTVITPAALSDLAQVLAPHGACDRLVWMLTRHALQLGPSYAFRDEDGLTLAIGGFCHNSDHVRECWAELAPAARRRMGEIVRLSRLTLSHQCQHDPRPVVVLAATRAGGRIAEMLGMRLVKAGVYHWRA